jgi:transcription-repair coupling factor (superfamily II helicase)
MPSKAVISQSTSPIALVKAGQRFVFDGATGSSDALAITSRTANRCRF